MDPGFWTSLSICTVLVAVSLWLIWAHWERSAAVEADESLENRQRDHLRRRYRRRIQTSTMLGVVGVAILGGRLFPPDQSGLAFIIYWFCVALLVLWMALLAMADIVSTRLYFGRLRRDVEIQRTALEAQLRRKTSGESRKPGPADRPPDKKPPGDGPGEQSPP